MDETPQADGVTTKEKPSTQMKKVTRSAMTPTPARSDAIDTLAHAAEIAARLDRLPSSRTVWTILALISAGGIFEFYDVFFTAYVAPGMIKAGLFTPQSLGFFGALQGIAVMGFGTFVFSTFAGLWLGIVLLGHVADRFGRKPVFVASLLWYLVCTTSMAFQISGEALNIFRLIAGIGFGVQLVTIDTYISELMPCALRGRAFSINQCITFAIVPVVALLAWLLVPHTIFGLDGWRIVVLIGSGGSFLVLLLTFATVPESPRWLATHGRAAEAEKILADIECRVEAEQGRALPPPVPAVTGTAPHVQFKDIFGPTYRTRTVMLSIFNAAQAIGFYGFNSWVPTLLVARGINLTHSLEYSFIMAIAQPFGPALGALFLDAVERKVQIIGGLLMMGLAMLAFALLSSPLALIATGVVFVLAGNILSFAYHNYQAELYPTRIRARAVGFVYSWSRLAAAFGGLAVGYFLHVGGVLAVAAFIGTAMLVGITMIGLFGPRTKGLALEEINSH